MLMLLPGYDDGEGEEDAHEDGPAGRPETTTAAMLLRVTASGARAGAACAFVGVFSSKHGAVLTPTLGARSIWWGDRLSIFAADPIRLLRAAHSLTHSLTPRCDNRENHHHRSIKPGPAGQRAFVGRASHSAQRTNEG